MSEQRFERKMTKILEQKGYLVINCARSKPFDLVIMKGGFVYLVELKGLIHVKKANKTYKYPAPYPLEQEAMQHELAKKADVPMALIFKSTKRGKLELRVRFCNSIEANRLHKDLEEFIL